MEEWKKRRGIPIYQIVVNCCRSSLPEAALDLELNLLFIMKREGKYLWINSKSIPVREQIGACVPRSSCDLSGPGLGPPLLQRLRQEFEYF